MVPDPTLLLERSLCYYHLDGDGNRTESMASEGLDWF
jgi:hypothetical protein